METINELIEEEMRQEFQTLGDLPADGESATKIIENLAKLNDMRKDRYDRYIRYGLEAAGIVLPLLFYGTWMRRGLRFEETGTFTSATFRGLMGKFRPTR